MTPPSRLVIDVSAAPTLLAGKRAVAHQRPVEADLCGLPARAELGPVLANAHLVVLGANFRDGTPAEEVARRLRRSHPHIGIFVVATQGECEPRRLPGLAHAGVDELYFVDAPGEYERLADHVRRRLVVPPPEEALRVVVKSEGSRHPVTMWLLRNAYRNPSIDDAAAHFGRHRTTVWRWLSDAGLPDPGTILRCGRLLHVWQLRNNGHESKIVADRMGLESEAGVRMILHRANGDDQLKAALQQLGLGADG